MRVAFKWLWQQQNLLFTGIKMKLQNICSIRMLVMMWFRNIWPFEIVILLFCGPSNNQHLLATLFSFSYLARFFLLIAENVSLWLTIWQFDVCFSCLMLLAGFHPFQTAITNMDLFIRSRQIPCRWCCSQSVCTTAIGVYGLFDRCWRTQALALAHTFQFISNCIRMYRSHLI